MIHQGRKYQVHGRQCIAMQSGSSAEFCVLEATPDAGDIPRFIVATKDNAKPMPMKYYGNELPPEGEL